MSWYGRIDNGFHRVNHAAVAINKTIYSFGGYSDCYFNKNRIDIFVFNTEICAWSSVSYFAKSEDAVPPHFFGHTVVEYENKIYLWGGLTNNERPNNVLYCFDPETLEWSLPTVHGHIPDGTDGHTASVIKDHMYVIGGYGSRAMTPMSYIFKLDLRTFKWEAVTTGGHPPNPRDFHTASVIGSKIYIYGGREFPYNSEREHYSKNIVSLDTEDMTWKTSIVNNSFMPVGRRSHSAVVYRNEIYIFFGFNSLKKEFFNQIYKFNPVLNVWKQIVPKYNALNPCTPCKRRRQCCILIDDRVYAFGGTSPKCEGGLLCDHYPLHNSNDPPLKDHCDLYIFDFFPTLRNLCLFEVVHQKLNYSFLPSTLQREINYLMTGKSSAYKICSCFQGVPRLNRC